MKSKTFNISVVLADKVPVLVNGKRLEGELDKVAWSQAEIIATGLRALIEDLAIEVKVVQSCFLSEESGKAEFGFNLDFQFQNDAIPAANIVNNYLSQVLGNSIENLDLFEIEDETTQNVIAKHRNEFIYENGGRAIKHPLVFKMNGLNLHLQGKFKVLPRMLPEIRPAFIFHGIVDGMHRSARKLFLTRVDGAKLTIIYNLQRFDKIAYVALGSQNMHKFIIQPNENEKGVLKMILNGLEEMPPQPFLKSPDDLLVSSKVDLN
jgi:hypothetical protein